MDVKMFSNYINYFIESYLMNGILIICYILIIIC